MRASGDAARLMLRTGAADAFLSATVVTTEEDDQHDHTQPVVTHWCATHGVVASCRLTLKLSSLRISSGPKGTALIILRRDT